METKLPAKLLETPEGARANQILRTCVHCGFCNAACPTYRLTGDELDGPRGRIYLIKELLEAGQNTERATHHLDRCLTCRACETVCPSGVAYGELAEIARDRLGPSRAGLSGFLRGMLRWLVPEASRLRFWARLGRPFKRFLPTPLAEQIPVNLGKTLDPTTDKLHERGFAKRVILLQGCAQQVATAEVNLALQRLLARRGIGVLLVSEEGCCGALNQHLGAKEQALAEMRRNVERIYPMLRHAEAVISTASGCGVTVKDYARLLAHDSAYAERAAAVAKQTLDIGEYLDRERLTFTAAERGAKVAWHPPCTLQHGQGKGAEVESLLIRAGYELVPVVDRELCCGAAGTYAVLQSRMASQLRRQKLDNLMAEGPDIIATANVGCQTHLAAAEKLPVKHWIELLN